MAWSACWSVSQRSFVALERARLGLAMKRKRLDHLRDQSGQVALEVRRVPPLDDVVRDEREVVADEDARAEGDADGETTCRGCCAGRPYPRSRCRCCEATEGRSSARRPR